MIIGKFSEQKEGRWSKGVRDGYGMGLWEATSSWKDFKNRCCLIVGNRRTLTFQRSDGAETLI